MLATANSSYLARVGIYTNIYNTIAIPKLLNLTNKKLNYIIFLIIISLYIIFWYIDVKPSLDLNPFKWVFNRTNYYIK